MTVRALCMGNDYYGANALQWCRYDCDRMAAWIQEHAPGAEIDVLKDASREVILETLKAFAESVGVEERGILTYSGHGSFLPDRNGDEVDGRDETWISGDLRHIVDDELNACLDRARGPVIVYSDSCHSGTVTRAMLDRSYLFGTPLVARYLPPDDLPPLTEVPVAGRIGTGHGVLLRGGCRDDQYSFESSGGSGIEQGGVFTSALLATYQVGMTHQQHHAAVRRVLPTATFPQNPRLYGGINLRGLPVFP